MSSRVWGAADVNSPMMSQPEHDVVLNPFDNPTPLFRAVFSGFPDCVAVLLSHPLVDVNVADSRGETALHHCASTRPSPLNLRILSLLCAHPGVDFNQVDSNNTTALWVACYGNNFEIARHLLAHAPLGAIDLDIRAIMDPAPLGAPASMNIWRGCTAEGYSRSAD